MIKIFCQDKKNNITIDELIYEINSIKYNNIQPFNNNILDFCINLSNDLFDSTKDPSLITLAFWLRRSNILFLKKEYESLYTKNTILVPYGILFHILPSNVDVIFIYSWIFSLLLGNSNVLKISSKKSDQTNILLKILDNLFKQDKYDLIKKNTLIITYNNDDNITKSISNLCNMRVIWGGDDTIKNIKLCSPINKNEIIFRNRFSYAAIYVKQFLELKQSEQLLLIKKFYNDSYTFNQMGCSSPKIIFFIGEESEFKKITLFFWEKLENEIKNKNININVESVIKKFNKICIDCIEKNINDIFYFSNDLTVIDVNLKDIDRQLHPGFGYFYQTRVDNLDEIISFVKEEDQTLVYFGPFEDIKNFIIKLNGKGIDRVVKLGQALDFNRYWDGIDFLQSMSKRIYIE